MRNRICVIPLTLVAFFVYSELIHAQYATPPVADEWNGLMVDVIPVGSGIPGFVDIIPGATKLDPPVSTSSLGERIYTLPLPFDIFVGQHHPPPSSIQISSSGYISFNGETETDEGSSPYNLRVVQNHTVYQDHLLMPFWGDFIESSNPNGGVWWKVEGQATNPPGAPGSWQALIIEWVVEDRSTHTPIGRFQAKFFSYNPYKIELHYSPAPPFSLSLPTLSDPAHYGAVVGLKNQGQDQPPDRGASHNLQQMIILDPQRHLGSLVGGGNPTYLTQLGYFTALTPSSIPLASTIAPVPEWYAHYFLFNTSNTPPYIYSEISPFHFGFPKNASSAPVSYRIRPIVTDVAPPVWPGELQPNPAPIDTVVKMWLPDPKTYADCSTN